MHYILFKQTHKRATDFRSNPKPLHLFRILFNYLHLMALVIFTRFDLFSGRRHSFFAEDGYWFYTAKCAALLSVTALHSIIGTVSTTSGKDLFWYALAFTIHVYAHTLRSNVIQLYQHPKQGHIAEQSRAERKIKIQHIQPRFVAHLKSLDH